ncbi:hypothetical protein BJ166DRAFT_619903 [Pestalotiopsis sp. NC0098]|nr:hypothetical protein BJ166DRAFT_619903 [Pestalotiopsis sp. NC0098]
MSKTPEEIRDILRAVISYPPDCRRDYRPGEYWTLLVDRRRPGGCHVTCLLNEAAVLGSKGLETTPYIIFHHDETQFSCHCAKFCPPESQQESFARINQFAVKASRELSRRWPDTKYDASMHYQMLWLQVLHWAVDKIGRPRRADGRYPDFRPELPRDCSEVMFLSLCQDYIDHGAQEEATAWGTSLYYWVGLGREQVRELCQRDWMLEIRAQEVDYLIWSSSIEDETREVDSTDGKAVDGQKQDETTIPDNDEPTAEVIKTLFRQQSHARRVGKSLGRDAMAQPEEPMVFQRVARQFQNLSCFLRRKIYPHRQYMTREYIETKREKDTIDDIIDRLLEEDTI